MRWRELVDAGRIASGALGVPVRLHGARRPLSPSALTAGERRTWEALAEGPRRRDWLLGRAALRHLLPDGANETSSVAFPHRRLSLTHAGGTAVAARCDADVTGTGVDMEQWRPEVDLRVARFFLGEAEGAWLASLLPSVARREVLRMWTVKEALYKATAGNAPLMLADYELELPGARAGRATNVHGASFRYASLVLPAGPLAVAVAAEGGEEAA